MKRRGRPARSRNREQDEAGSVVVGATEVVAAVGADQLAMVAGEAMAAVGADLAVMVDGKSVASGAERTTL